MISLLASGWWGSSTTRKLCPFCVTARWNDCIKALKRATARARSAEGSVASTWASRRSTDWSFASFAGRLFGPPALEVQLLLLQFLDLPLETLYLAFENPLIVLEAVEVLPHLV